MKDPNDEDIILVNLEDMRALLRAWCERAHSEHNVPLEDGLFAVPENQSG